MKPNSIRHLFSSMSKCISFTASKDWLYRYSFKNFGLRSTTTDFGDGTIMHCWVPKDHNKSKPNLLLVHGFGANAMWQYNNLLHHITRFNIYVPDLLFFGRSKTTQSERSVKFQATCLMKLMDAHGVMKMNIVGVSYGGFVAYSMASECCKDRIERLVLCCAGVCLKEEDFRDGLFPVSDVDEAACILLPQTPDKLRELMQFSFVNPTKGVPSFFLADFITVMCSEHAQEKRDLIKAILEDRKLSSLPKITQPTLVLWGEQDQIFPLELGQRLKRHIGDNAQLAVIQNAGHAVNLEKPKEFAKQLKLFLFDSISSVPSIGSHESKSD